MSAEENSEKEITKIETEEVNGEQASNHQETEDARSEEAKEEEIDEQQLLIEQLQQELADSKELLLRKAAELENIRKRVQKERIALFEESKIVALEDFLPISEDMKRVMEAADASKIEKGFLEGLKLIGNKFEEVISKYGVEAINKVNVPFDVELHDAMLKQSAPNKKTKSDTVLQVLESGYKIGNRVIKHAKVIVSE